MGLQLFNLSYNSFTLYKASFSASSSSTVLTVDDIELYRRLNSGKGRCEPDSNEAKYSSRTAR